MKKLLLAKFSPVILFNSVFFLFFICEIRKEYSLPAYRLANFEIAFNFVFNPMYLVFVYTFFSIKLRNKIFHQIANISFMIISCITGMLLWFYKDCKKLAMLGLNLYYRTEEFLPAMLFITVFLAIIGFVISKIISNLGNKGCIE